MCRETVRKFVCAETFLERVAYPPRSQMTEPYLRADTCCTAHPLPSGSLKKTNDPQSNT